MSDVFNLHQMMDSGSGASPEVQKVMKIVQQLIAQGMDEKEAKAKGIELMLSQADSKKDPEEDMEVELSPEGDVSEDAPNTDTELSKVKAAVRAKQAPQRPASSYPM